MTRNEMIEFIKNNPYVHITHVLFADDEYIYSDNHFNHGTFTKSVICVAD